MTNTRKEKTMKLLGFTVGGVLLGLVLGGVAVWIVTVLGMADMAALVVGGAVWCLVSIIGLGVGCILQFK